MLGSLSRPGAGTKPHDLAPFSALESVKDPIICL